MKHLQINDICPYTYYIKHKKSNIKYYGVRWANVKKKISPSEDFLKIYFTSIRSIQFKWFRDLLKKDINEFEYRIHYTFDSKEEAIEYEKILSRKIFLRKDWANLCAGKAINLSNKTQEELDKIYLKRHRAMLGKNTGKRSEKIKEKMRNNHQDFSGKNHPQFGLKHSEARKSKVSNSMKEFYIKNPDKIMFGSKNGMYGKGRNYKAISPDGIEYLIYAGIKDFCNEHNISESAPSRCSQGKGRQSKGWRFEYI